MVQTGRTIRTAQTNRTGRIGRTDRTAQTMRIVRTAVMIWIKIFKTPEIRYYFKDFKGYLSPFSGRISANQVWNLTQSAFGFLTRWDNY